MHLDSIELLDFIELILDALTDVPADILVINNVLLYLLLLLILVEVIRTFVLS
jgi:hypothetical protein